MSQDRRRPIMDFPVQRIVGYMNSKEQLPFVLLGIGPMSELVIKTALEMARDTQSPAMIIASRNQVETEELGGGYVDSTSRFVQNILSVAQEVDFDGLLYICRDHGGPWQRNDEKQLEPDEAWERALRSYSADIKAGFNLLHIDPTLSKKGEPAPDMHKVIQDTVRFIEHCEKEAGGKPLSYEVGTEAIAGKTISLSDFEEFIRTLLSELNQHGLPRPSFIVGQTGTLVRMDRNVGTVDPAAATGLASIARKYGLGFKEHNADYLPDFILAHHRRWGITAANVAPEFGVVETKACLHLADIEQQLVNSKRITKDEASCFWQEIANKVISGNRWKKWLYSDASELHADRIRQTPSLARHIVEVNGHYVFGDKEVVKQKQKMLSNIARLGLLETSPEEIIHQAIRASITRYIELFGLAKSTPAIPKA